ncbi:hypothetical protein Ocin01_13489 [Orchesella cincta]|uniref:Uncharacterized protein n=1 Tax=Orchesella cincta TaxID=48709 RepID=A0A1D2MJL6_ORCCI|nr:hypothetical protein Ocin01_13489 [Orchesella cincta]
MAKLLLFGALVIGAAMVMVNADDLIEVPKEGSYEVVNIDVKKSRQYATDLGWNKEQTEDFMKMIADDDFGVRFKNEGNNHFNITFYGGGHASNMEIEDGKELNSKNIVGIPVKNKLTVEAKKLTIRQTYDSGKHADIIWTFQKPDIMIINHSANDHPAQITLKKDDSVGKNHAG